MLCLAVILDQVLGDPVNFPHPVRLIGHVINFWHKVLFTDTHSFKRGLVLCVMTLATTGLSAWLVLYISGCNMLVQIYMLYSAIAWKDLKDETASVLCCLLKNDIYGARKCLSFVVGRDTENLDGKDIISALIETIAENSIDGIISVIFFAAVGYVACESYGMIIMTWLYKSANTLDSTIGYEKFHEYGTTSARLDDLLNFIPARLGGLIIVAAAVVVPSLRCGVTVREAFMIFIHDRKNHASPNSAHGESAFAGVLGIKLGGGAFYDGAFEFRPCINDKARAPEIYDIVRAWTLLDISCALFVLMACVILR